MIDTEQQGDRDWRSKVGIPLVLLLGAAVFAFLTVSGNAAAQADKQHHGREIAGLKTQLAAAGAPLGPTSEDPGVAALKTQLADARKLGTTVAKQQQGFANLTDGAKVAQQRRVLAGSWTKDSFVVDDAHAYAPDAKVPFKSDQVDPRFPWLALDHRTSAPASAEWKLASVTPPVGTDDEITVTWLALDHKSKALRAWATATYNTEENKFENLNLGVTKAGGGRS